MQHNDCPSCGNQMRETHSHFECRYCGFVEPCCQGAPGSVRYDSDIPILAQNAYNEIGGDLHETCAEALKNAVWDGICDECEPVVKKVFWGGDA